jgi:hypothetical protein
MEILNNDIYNYIYHYLDLKTKFNYASIFRSFTVHIHYYTDFIKKINIIKSFIKNNKLVSPDTIWNSSILFNKKIYIRCYKLHYKKEWLLKLPEQIIKKNRLNLIIPSIQNRKPSQIISFLMNPEITIEHLFVIGW